MLTNEQKEAKDKISNILREIEDKLAEATKIADAASVDFYWEGPSYGMGGHYTPEEYGEKWGESAGWAASSQSC